MKLITLHDPTGDEVDISIDAIIRVRNDHGHTCIDLYDGFQIVKETRQQVRQAIYSGD